MTRHPRAQLDPVIHAPARFSVAAALAAADEVEFRFVRDSVELSDSALSKHVSTLEEAGYVRVRKGAVGRRPRTYLKLTEAGREAFTRHVGALRSIAEGAAIPPAGASGAD
ncbi:winged helix-turn-helix domain-containing protein [Nocardiopsis coralliicola]